MTTQPPAPKPPMQASTSKSPGDQLLDTLAGIFAPVLTIINRITVMKGKDGKEKTPLDSQIWTLGAGAIILGIALLIIRLTHM